MNDRWRKLNDTMHQYVPLRASMCQHVPTLQFVSCAEKDSLCGTVMIAWTENAWINAMVFVPIAQSPPKAGSKELLYKFDRWVYILGFAEGDLCRFACKNLPTVGRSVGRSETNWTVRKLIGVGSSNWATCDELISPGFLIPRSWVHETCCIKFPIVVRTDWATSKLISTHLTDNPWINFLINPGGTSVGTPLRQGISIFESKNLISRTW